MEEVSEEEEDLIERKYIYFGNGNEKKEQRRIEAAKERLTYKLEKE